MTTTSTDTLGGDRASGPDTPAQAAIYQQLRGHLSQLKLTAAAEAPRAGLKECCDDEVTKIKSGHQEWYTTQARVGCAAVQAACVRVRRAQEPAPRRPTGSSPGSVRRPRKAKIFTRGSWSCRVFARGWVGSRYGREL